MLLLTVIYFKQKKSYGTPGVDVFACLSNIDGKHRIFLLLLLLLFNFFYIFVFLFFVHTDKHTDKNSPVPVQTTVVIAVKEMRLRAGCLNIGVDP